MRLLLHWLLNAALRRVDGVIGVSAGILAPYPERLIPAARRRVVASLPPPEVTAAGPLPDVAEGARRGEAGWREGHLHDDVLMQRGECVALGDHAGGVVGDDLG